MSIRKFKSGSTRDTDKNKHDIEAFINPLVMDRYYAYMNQHRRQSDGKLREGDNWQKGFGKDVCAKSLMRHVHDFHLAHRGYKSQQEIDQSLCAIIFNAMAYILEDNKKHG